MKRFLVILTAAVVSAELAKAEVPHLSLSLPQVIEAAYRKSPELKAVEFRSKSAVSLAKSLRGSMAPTLSLEGSAKRVSEVPELTFPSGQTLKMTDNESYSFGPTARYTLFKGGADYYSWKSSKARMRSAQSQEQLIRRKTKLAAQLAYFQAQLAGEQVRLLVESYKVEDQQYRDIKNQFSAGSSDRVDLLSAHQQTLNRRRQLLDARAELAIALRELTRLTGLGVEVDPSLPIDGQTSATLPFNVDTPTVVLNVDSTDHTLEQMSKAFTAEFNKWQPGIQYFADLADASRLAGKSLQGSRWPELNLLAKISRDYPNGPVEETITQKTVGATLDFPIFTGGKFYYRVDAQDAQTEAAEQDREAAARDLEADWLKARDQVNVLRAQRGLCDTTIKESEELAKLQYQSYRAGRARYLDVEDANLKVLQARTDAARTDVRMLVQLATLESLSSQSNKE